MPIKVSCHCGQSFMAKDELRGQTLLCPKCHQPLTIGEGVQSGATRRSSGGIADLFDEVGIKEVQGPRCPQCAAALRPNAVLCVECGYNLQTQQRVQAARVRKAGERGHGEAAEVLLELAAQRIQEDKLEDKKNRSQGMPAWVYFIALCILAGFTVAMFMIPRDQAFAITGWSIFGIGWLASFYFQIRLLIVAFSESPLCGILYIVLSPFYTLYYIITRWDNCGGFFLMQIASSAVSFVGFGITLLGPLMAESPAESVSRPAAIPRAVAVAAYEPQTPFPGNTL